ncbi:hypothetical protein, partial [Luteimonas panaciterrae]|uniref:DUF7940 domain-containing protein n=1 Tax=Luteimonas panaciterrae TaxID=363885 RepID=UPI001CFB7A17
MKLIDNWKTSWRLFNVQAMAVALAVQATWTGLPEALRASLPEWVGNPRFFLDRRPKRCIGML